MCIVDIVVRRFRVAALVPLVLVLAVSGCAKTAKVSGKVNWDGKPLPAGKVKFKCGDKVTSAEVLDGEFTCNDAPIGTCQVGVETDYLMNTPPPSAGFQPGAQMPPGLTKEQQEKYEKDLLAKMSDEEKANYNKQKEEAGSRKDMTKLYKELPEKYHDPGTSGVTITVNKGTNSDVVINFDRPTGWKESGHKMPAGGQPGGGMGGMGGMPR